jgi:hypothetical protein
MIVVDEPAEPHHGRLIGMTDDDGIEARFPRCV